MRSQCYIRMERELATSDTKWMAAPNEQKKDFLGNPIFTQHFGEWSSKTILNVIKCNQGKTGPVPVLMINGYFKILDAPE